MFKRIPGNSDFEIDLLGNLRKVNDEKGCTPVIHENKIRIEIYGQSRIVDVSWLSLLAHFEVFLPKGLEHRLFDIHFTVTDLARKSVTNQMMLIDKPIIVNVEYRIIPCFVKYAVSKKGEVIEVESGEIVKVETGDGFAGYPTVSIYDPEANKKRGYVIHRLVAMAWIKNDDYFSKPIVNHIDGNKRNYHFSNLEWVSYSENSLHAVNTGLRSDNIPCKVFDITDKSVKEFQSVKQAVAYMGLHPDVKLNNLLSKLKHKLINDRYQVKLSGDNSKWFYEKYEPGTPSGQYTLFIEKPDGTKVEHPDVRTFKRDYGVWNTSNVDELLKKAAAMYPDHKFSYVDNFIRDPVQAYHIPTDTIVEAKTVRALSRQLKIGYTSLRAALAAGETRKYKDYAFRYKTDKPWDTDFTEFICSPKCILATSLENEEVMTFESERKAAAYFNVQRSAIRLFLRIKKPLKGFLLKYKETDK